MYKKISASFYHLFFLKKQIISYLEIVKKIQRSILVILLLGSIYPSFALEISRSDILLNIATQCINPKTQNYCNQCVSPRIDSSCGNPQDCKNTTEIWSENEQFVSIRDIKMCGCSKDFIHGLTMPRSEVTGIEDIRRQEEIWQFAWETSKKIIEPDLIALVVNPKSHRSQNQLHVHLVRIDPKVKNKFNAYIFTYVKNLDHVWETAGKLAAKNSLIDYGILVTRATSNQFTVLITPNSPESEFTIWKCN
ncbi:CDP-diacylglycerol diphosphatase [Candidatus Methylopumilus planktonicus]|mgnify:FL=1|jgi:CDP-diacylglycerol pyrophosphatase|uniref:CDP-diacylglycerol diphosphatase n=1 Tax=Candidatus Methylopumilus planktonicus TaxID=1581557 RepID=UPI003BEEDC70